MVHKNIMQENEYWLLVAAGLQHSDIELLYRIQQEKIPEIED